jgi:hypothetical protein
MPHLLYHLGDSVEPHHATSTVSSWAQCWATSCHIYCIILETVLTRVRFVWFAECVRKSTFKIGVLALNCERIHISYLRTWVISVHRSASFKIEIVMASMVKKLMISDKLNVICKANAYLFSFNIFISVNISPLFFLKITFHVPLLS